MTEKSEQTRPVLTATQRRQVTVVIVAALRAERARRPHLCDRFLT